MNAARYSLLADIRDVDPPSSVRVPGITLELTWHTQLRATRLWRLSCCHRIGYLGLRHRWSIHCRLHSVEFRHTGVPRQWIVDPINRCIYGHTALCPSALS